MGTKSEPAPMDKRSNSSTGYTEGPLCVKSFGVTQQGESSNLITDYFVAKIHNSGSATIFFFFSIFPPVYFVVVVCFVLFLLIVKIIKPANERKDQNALSTRVIKQLKNSWINIRRSQLPQQMESLVPFF